MDTKRGLTPYVLILQFTAVALIITFSSTLALAQEHGSETKEWRFAFVPYIWITSMSGQLTVQGRTVDIDASFGDILDQSDSLFAFMGILSATEGAMGRIFGRHLYETGYGQFKTPDTLLGEAYCVHNRPIGLFRIWGTLSIG